MKFDFADAVRALKDGKRVRRAHWCEGHYLYLEDGRVHEAGTHAHSDDVIWIPKNYEVITEDWGYA